MARRVSGRSVTVDLRWGKEGGDKYHKRIVIYTSHSNGMRLESAKAAGIYYLLILFPD